MSKSRNAKIMEKIVKTVVLPKGKTMSEVIMNYRKARKKQKYDLPLFVKIRDDVDEIYSKGMKLFYMNVESQSDSIIIYLHGGAYVEEMLPLHWLMLDKIAAKVDSTIIIPDYPLAPFSDFRDCYRKMLSFYKKVIEYYPDRKIILMGDSAGAGLSAGLAMYFTKKELRVPDQLILLSPWIDLTMSNPEMKKYKKKDVSLHYDELCVYASHWANGTDLNDYRLSPLYGDVSGLNDVNIFVGTAEMFYPDIMLFKEKLDRNKIRYKVIIAEDMPHVYPAYPTPEADEAIEIMCRIIKRKRSAK